MRTMKEMKTMTIYALICLLLLSFAACGQEQTDDASLDGTVIEGNNGETEPSQASPEKMYKAILQGSEDFISADLENRSVNIEEIGRAVMDDDSVTVSAAKFTVIDLDGDGENELVLWLQVNGVSDIGFEVLHNRDGAVYGYTLYYREFFNLKTDGTFTFSGGSADSGTGRLTFTDAGYSVEELVSSQDQKPDAEWYELSADSIVKILGQ